MDNFDVSSVPQSETEVDVLLSSIESPEAPPLPAEQGEAPETKPEVAPSVPQPVDEHTINWRGQERKLTLDQLKNYAQQAYDYNEKMRQYNVDQQLFQKSQAQKEEEWKRKYADVDSRVSRYGEIEAYIKQDPQWWQHVQESYAQRRDQGIHASPNDGKIQSLEQTVNELKGTLSTLQEREKLLEAAKQDEELDGAIGEYKTQYSQFDWKTTDNNGLDLEKRILDHAIRNNIGTFRAAANDYLHDEFIKRSELKAKEEAGKEIKKVTKLGLGPVTTKPTAKIQGVKNPGAKSWNDDEYSAESILQELGIA